MSQEPKKTQLNSRLLLTIFLLENLLLLLLTLSQCVTGEGKPQLDGPIYFGDSNAQELYSTQGRAAIKCSNPHFEEMICLERGDFDKIITR